MFNKALDALKINPNIPFLIRDFLNTDEVEDTLYGGTLFIHNFNGSVTVDISDCYSKQRVTYTIGNFTKLVKSINLIINKIIDDIPVLEKYVTDTLKEIRNEIK